MLFGINGRVEPTVESTEFTPEEQGLVVEAAMLESLSKEELDAFLENASDVNNAVRLDIVQERTIVRLDKKAKLSRAYMASVFNIARKKKDKKFKKLQMLWKLEAAIEKYLIKRYGNEAMREAKKAVQNANKANSGMIKKAVNNVKKSLNGIK